MTYETPHYTMIVSSTEYVMLVQVLQRGTPKQLLSASEIKSELSEVFRWQGVGDPPGDRWDVDFLETGPNRTKIPITDLSGNPYAHWFQKPGTLASYLLNWDNQPNRPTLPSFNLWPNSRFFTARPDEEKTHGYWQGYENGGQQIVLDNLVASSDETNDPFAMEATAWCSKNLTPAYQVPSGLKFVSIPKERTGGVETSQIRYSVSKQIVTIQQTPVARIVQLDFGPFTLTPKATLSEEKVEDWAHSVFADSAAAVANANPGSTTEGSISVSPTSKAAWLNSVKWWQEPGRLVFYWNTANK
jgi:hypothetical protein